ncbi:mCG1031629, partial [Mus musculus]
WRRSRLSRSTQAHSLPSSFPSSSSHPAPGGAVPWSLGEVCTPGGWRPPRRAGVGTAAAGGRRRGPLPHAPSLPPPAPCPSSSPSSPSSSWSPAAAARGTAGGTGAAQPLSRAAGRIRAQCSRPRGDGGGCEDLQSWKNGRGAGPASPPPLSPPSPSPPPFLIVAHPTTPPHPPSHLPVYCQLCQTISFTSGNT